MPIRNPTVRPLNYVKTVSSLTKYLLSIDSYVKSPNYNLKIDEFARLMKNLPGCIQPLHTA